MGKYILVYKGGGMGDTADAQEKAMADWMKWFANLGPAVVDGGAPFGAAQSVDSTGKAGPTSSGLSGYSIIEADSLDQAAARAGGCPVLASGGSIDIYETVPVG